VTLPPGVSWSGPTGHPLRPLRVPGRRPGPAPARPPALLGWVAGAWVVRFGWVSPGRLASAGGVTGALALLHIGPTVAAGRLLDAVVALAMFCPGSLTVGALLEALSAVLVRGVGWPGSRCRPGSWPPPSRPVTSWPRSPSRPSGSAAAGRRPAPPPGRAARQPGRSGPAFAGSGGQLGR